MGERFLTRKEVAERIGVSEMTVWRWEKAGRFPSRRQVRPGGSVRYLESELTEWMRSRPIVNAPEPEAAEVAG